MRGKRKRGRAARKRPGGRRPARRNRRDLWRADRGSRINALAARDAGPACAASNVRSIIGASLPCRGAAPMEMTDPGRLAFVDVETTGLDPTTDRIAEIGVVTVDDGAPAEWGTFVVQKRGAEPRAPRAAAGSIHLLPAAAPTFKDIALELTRRLAGRLFVAHNARFDYAFVKAELARAGIAF